MRVAKIVLVVWLFCELGLWIREGLGFSLLDTLPFVQRSQPLSAGYDRLALAAIMIGLWGYAMMPKPQPGQQQQQQQGGRFRSGIFLVPLTIIALAALSQRLHSTLRFGDLVGYSRLDLEHRHLALLSLCVFAVLLAIKTLRNR